MIYFEWRYLVRDYAYTVKCREILFDFIGPLLIVVLSYFAFIKGANINEQRLNNALPYIVSLLAVLVGFSVTCISVIVSSGSANIDVLRREPTKRRLDGKTISLYQLLLIGFAFGLVLELALLAFNLVFCIAGVVSQVEAHGKIFLVVNLGGLLVTLCLLLRTVTNFYMSIWKDRDKSYQN